MNRFERRRDGAPEILDLNLLPANQRPAEMSSATVLVIVGLVITILAIAPLALRLSHAKDSANAAARQADGAEQALHAVQVDLAQHSALQTDLASTRVQLDALTAIREQLQGGHRALVTDLAELSRPEHLPAQSALKTVADTQTGLRIEGTAPGPLDAIAYAERLMKEAGFPSAKLISFAPAGLGGQFVIEVTR